MIIHGDTQHLAEATWQLGRVSPTQLWQSGDMEQVREWLPATVPGNLENDLLQLGLIPDPFVETQNEEGRWVEGWDWWYRCHAHVPLEPDQSAHLILHGIDYYSAAFANNTPLANHEGMFSAQEFDVTDLVWKSVGQLEIAVRLWGAHALPQPRQQGWPHLAAPLLRRVAGDTDMFPSRIDALKCQMSFGWDFAPCLPTIGIWDSAEVVTTGPVHIQDAWVQANVQGPDAECLLKLSLRSTIGGPARCTVTVQGENFADQPQRFEIDVKLSPGDQAVAVAFLLPSARVWQPWDRGEPYLYRLDVELQPAGRQPSRARTTFGVRSIELAATAWQFRVNGQREFVRGLNWVPLDVLPGRVRPADYAAMIGMAKAANANMLRVWGGGLREKRAFYDLCDWQGMLVWQEFPLSCPNLSRFRRDAAFLRLLEQEATGIVQALRDHPAVVLWAGGNEFGPSKNQPIVEALRRVVAANDGTRPFVPASPSTGDRHNWHIWHHFAPLADYPRETAPFVSEFGLQSAPDMASLQRFLPGAETWPPGPAWAYHNAQLGKLFHYAGPEGVTSASTTLESFVEATQKAQSRGLQIMIEHMRRRKGSTGGVMVWQLNEPWPSICWSLVARHGQPKPAFEMVRRVFAPLLISVNYEIKAHRPGDTADCAVWVVNDGAMAIGEATVILTLNGDETYRQDVGIGADCSTQVASVRIKLPDATGPWLLCAELRRGEALLAKNEYDLSYYDARPMPLLQRALVLFGRWLLH